MGYWISYLGVGYGGELRPYFGDGGVLLFALPVVIAGLLTPALALTGFAWTRKHPYGPFALLLVIVGLLIMSAGFPEGTPLRKASNFTYNHFVPVQFLRTTYKAGPLVVIGLAVLGGLGGAAHPETRLLVAALDPSARRELAADPRARRRRPAAVGRDPRGVARRRRRTSTRPSTTDARSSCPASSTPTTTGAGRSTRSCPCWRTSPSRPATPSGTPTCARRICCGRSTRSCSSAARSPASSTRCSTCSAPGPSSQGADEDRTRSGATPARRGRGHARSNSASRRAAWGDTTARPRAAGTLGDPVELPQVRAWDRPGAPGLVRVEAPDPPTVVDGSAEGLARGRGPARRRRVRRRPRTGAAAPREAGGDHGLQPPSRARPVAAGPERGPGAGGGRGAVGRRRRARPVRQGQRRADRRRLRRRDHGRERAVVARLSAVPGEPAVRRARRRPGDALAGRSRADARPPRPDGLASARRATSRTSI